jgi:hypothetical protein
MLVDGPARQPLRLVNPQVVDFGFFLDGIRRICLNL